MTLDDADDVASILVPITVTSAMITAMTANGVAVPEDASAPYAAATTYALGARVHSTVSHRVYESAKASNTGHDPTDITNQFNASGVVTWWIDIGPTNRTAMFDGLISTPTTGLSPLVITMQPGAFNGFALFGVSANSVSAVVKDAPGGNVVYTTGGDASLEGSNPGDYYEYFFNPTKPQTQFVVTGVAPYANAEITLTLKAAGGTVKLGMFTLGDLQPMGVPERGTRVSPKSYAYIAEDAYGNTTIKRRPSAIGLSMPIKVALEDADSVIQMIQDLLDVPVAVIGSTAAYHTKLSTFGLVSGDMDYSTYPDRTLNLTVKGFT